MNTEPNQHIEATISGPVGGQVAIGSNISQQMRANHSPPSAEELASLRKQLSSLQEQAVLIAPDWKKQATEEHMAKLEQAVLSEKPKLVTMAYVKEWLEENLPEIADAASQLILSPIVFRLVQAAGEAATIQFRSLFGV